MAPLARLAAVSLDCPDPSKLAAFYSQLLELEIMVESDDFVALQSAGVFLTMQRVANHRQPEWPDGDVPKQLHLELSVSDLEAAEAFAIGLGATKAASQPSPERWRVLIDPVGHPFCITTLIPE
jgi:hypothetical protein